MFKQFEEVQLNLDSLDEILFGEPVRLRKGQHGVVLDVLRKPGLPLGYNVEFFDNAGETVAVTTLGEKDLAPIDDIAINSNQEVA